MAVTSDWSCFWGFCWRAACCTNDFIELRRQWVVHGVYDWFDLLWFDLIGWLSNWQLQLTQHRCCLPPIQKSTRCSTTCDSGRAIAIDSTSYCLIPAINSAFFFSLSSITITINIRNPRPFPYQVVRYWLIVIINTIQYNSTIQYNKTHYNAPTTTQHNSTQHNQTQHNPKTQPNISQ